MAPYRWSFKAALALFVLAGLSGALLRYGMLYGFPWDLQFVNVRHAHSHLMYFGWVTPVLFGLIAAALPGLTGRPAPRGFGAVIGVTLLLALAAFVPFLLSGYQRTTIGELQLPLSTMLSGFNVLAWIAFIAIYLRATRGVGRTPPLQAFDAALLVLAVASGGALGLAVLGPLQLAGDTLMMGLVTFYLEIFSRGWFVLALLGLGYLALPQAIDRGAVWRLWLFLAGLLLAAAARLATASGLHDLSLIVTGGTLLASSSLLLSALRLLTRSTLVWLTPLLFLALTAGVDVLLLVPAVALWSEPMALAVILLHAFLLGFVTLGLWAAAVTLWQLRAGSAYAAMVGAVLVVLLSLVFVSGIPLPVARGRWVLEVALWAALLPVGVAAAALLGSRFLMSYTPLGAKPGQ